MTRTLRRDVFDPDTVGVYHCFNRIVRGNFLCGFDPVTQKDYAYRRDWIYQRLKYYAQYIAMRSNGEDEQEGHFWKDRFGMTRLLDDAAVLACLAYVDLNPMRAHATTSLEGYEHVSIGERLRTLENEAIDPSSWLAPIEIHQETNGQPAQVVNRMTREEVAAALEQQRVQPLGCLSITFEQYTDLLRWLTSPKPTADEGNPSVPPPQRGAKTILQQLSLDPSEFFVLVHNFRSQFSTAAGSEESLQREARRRGWRRLHAPGRRGLSPRDRQPAAP